jgi:hypothetical protein
VGSSIEATRWLVIAYEHAGDTWRRSRRGVLLKLPSRGARACLHVDQEVEQQLIEILAA